MTTAPVNLNALARIKFKWSHLASTWANERLAVMARLSGQTTWDTIWSKEGANFDSQDGATWNAPGTFVQETCEPGLGYLLRSSGRVPMGRFRQLGQQCLGG